MLGVDGGAGLPYEEREAARQRDDNSLWQNSSPGLSVEGLLKLRSRTKYAPQLHPCCRRWWGSRMWTRFNFFLKAVRPSDPRPTEIESIDHRFEIRALTDAVRPHCSVGSQIVEGAT